MLKEFLRYYLEVDQLEEQLQEVQEEAAEEEQVAEVEKSLEDLEARVRELEPVTVDLTNREREALEVFLTAEEGEYIDVQHIADQIDTSRTNAGSIVSNMKNKIDFDIKTVENNKKLYRLPQEERQKILGKN